MRSFIRATLAASLAASALMWNPQARAEVLDGASDAILLQGFHWESCDVNGWWNVVASRADDIAGSGFDMVWLPPSSRSADAAPEGYLPNELYTQNSRYGSQAQLEALIDGLHARGVSVLADLVLNHRVGTYNWADFTQPTWGADAVCQGDEWSGAAGHPDTGAPYSAARDIDHLQPYVRDSLVTWMNWMQDTIGYDGWRLDYVKGYAGSWAGYYIDATQPYFTVGEQWDTLDLNNPDAHRQQTVNWIDATGGGAAAFDFTTKGILQQAVAYNEFWRLKDGSGKPSGVIGWWPSHAVTFVDNHDTGPSTGGGGGQNHWPFPSDKVMQGYAYILTHPGIPTVYWPHFYDQGHRDAIRALMNVRLQEGLTSTSSVAIQVADSSRYAAIIGGKVAVKIGPGSWSPSSDYELATSGSGYAVWRKKATPPGTGKIRTVIFIYKPTQPGQDIYIRGGHDQALVTAGYYPSMSEPISYLNTKNSTTAAVKASDTSLDWFSDSALDWTTNSWPSSWGPAKYYSVDGYGVDPENTRGQHWWKFEVLMDGKQGDWFEFKAFMKQGSSTWWEPNISQSGTPHRTINHWGRMGYINAVSFGESWAELTPLTGG